MKTKRADELVEGDAFKLQVALYGNCPAEVVAINGRTPKSVSMIVSVGRPDTRYVTLARSFPADQVVELVE